MMVRTMMEKMGVAAVLRDTKGTFRAAVPTYQYGWRRPIRSRRYCPESGTSNSAGGKGTQMLLLKANDCKVLIDVVNHKELDIIW